MAGLLTGISRSRNIRGKEAKSLGRFSQDGTLLLKYTTSTAMRLTGWHCQVYHLGVQYSTPWWHQILEIILCQVCVLYMTFRLCLHQEGPKIYQNSKNGVKIVYTVNCNNTSRYSRQYVTKTQDMAKWNYLILFLTVRDQNALWWSAFAAKRSASILSIEGTKAIGHL